MLLLLLLSVIQLAIITSAKTPWETHPCNRECIEGSAPMTCAYHFKIEWYQSLSKSCFKCINGTMEDCFRPHCVSADGIIRPIVVVNRQLPGPNIRVCLGDRIVVDLENALALETSSLHWHGHHQRGSPHMDGVPHVTQCPVLPGSSFRYVFSADNPGTHFWHSHSGLQRADGVTGPLIIRQARDAQRSLYDRDDEHHVVHLMDWLHGSASRKFVFHHHGDGDNKPRSILINGRGRYGNGTFMADTVTPTVPLSIFTVIPGLRHRFRVINSGFLNCPLELSIDNHTLLVIASDGSDLQPVEVDSLVSFAGERFDFILHANQLVDHYWLRVRGLMDCDERFNSVHQVAVVAYKGDDDIEGKPLSPIGYAEAARGGKQLNTLNVGSNDNNDNTFTISEVSSLKPGNLNLIKGKPDHTIYLGYDFYKKDNPIFHHPGLYGFHDVLKKNERLLTPQLNHISLQLPSSPIIMQSESSLAPFFCNETSLTQQGRNCSSEFCRCLHRIRVEVGSVLQLVLVDEGAAFNANHPFHLHGHTFHVTAMHRVGEQTSITEVQKILEQGLIPLRSLHAPLKDTVTVPDGGFTVLRLHASNPGIWLFHCHIGFHAEIGMGLILQVGDWNSFKATPKGFPTCGNWLPDIDDTNTSESHEENHISLLNAGGINEQVQYRLIQNISNIRPVGGQPSLVVVQHMWPDWWPGNHVAHTNSSQCTTSNTLIWLINLIFIVFINYMKCK